MLTTLFYRLGFCEIRCDREDTGDNELSKKHSAMSTRIAFTKFIQQDKIRLIAFDTNSTKTDDIIMMRSHATTRNTETLFYQLL